MRLFLLRHGESESNVKMVLTHSLGKWPLTVRGREQAKNVAREICEMKVSFDGVVISPLARARETFEIIAKNCPKIAKASQKFSDRLIDAKMGVWNDKSWAKDPKLLEILRSRNKDRCREGFSRTHWLEGGESFAELAARMSDFLREDLAGFSDDADILVVSSGDPMMILQKIFVEILGKKLAIKYPDNAEIMEVEFSRSDDLEKLKKFREELRGER